MCTTEVHRGRNGPPANDHDVVGCVEARRRHEADLLGERTASDRVLRALLLRRLFLSYSFENTLSSPTNEVLNKPYIPKALFIIALIL